MSSINHPTPSFPNALDNDSTLLRVYNTAESKIAVDMMVKDDSIEVTPDFTSPEKWSIKGGFIHLDGEDIYYALTETIYAPSTVLKEAKPIFISQFDAATLGSAMMINGLLPDRVSGFSSVTLRDHRYTCAGTIKIGDQDVELAVQGDGPHGAGSTFYTSRPDLVQLPFCSIDADTGKIAISTISLGWSIKKIYWIEPVFENGNQPLRRVKRLYGLLRGLRKTKVKTHERGQIVRGYIMAEHHALLASALIAMEGMVGINASKDRSSQDFRLRDLGDLCIEEDDFGCPDPELNYTETTNASPNDQECLVTRSFDFEATILGDYNRFAIFFGDGTSTTDQLQATHRYPSGARVEPYIYAANDQCEVSSGFFDESVNAIEGLPDIPNLICPDILIPEIPTIPDITIPDFEPSNPQINFPSIFLSIPNSIYLSASLPDITLTVPNIPTLISVLFDPPPLTVVYTVNVNLPPDVGPCFQLIPCSSGYHHPGYH